MKAKEKRETITQRNKQNYTTINQKRNNKEFLNTVIAARLE